MITDEIYITKLIQNTTGRKVVSITPFTTNCSQSNDEAFGVNKDNVLFFGDYSGNFFVTADSVANVIVQYNTAPTNSRVSALKSMLVLSYATPVATTGSSIPRSFQFELKNFLFQFFDYYNFCIAFSGTFAFTFTGYKVVTA